MEELTGTNGIGTNGIGSNGIGSNGTGIDALGMSIDASGTSVKASGTSIKASGTFAGISVADAFGMSTAVPAATPIVVWHEGITPLGDIVATMGVFDGVHQGHQYLISHALADAEALNVPAWVITFDRDPEEVLRVGNYHHKLLSNTDRLRLLARTGVDGVLAIPFNEAFAHLTYDEFCETFIRPTASVRSLHVGVGFRYGTKTQGTTETLGAWMSLQGGKVTAHELFDEGGSSVSATRIRGLLANCEVEEANRLLTRPFFLKGAVVEGRGVGKELGIPTANLKPEFPAVTLGDGVYGGYVFVAATRYRAAISIGLASTFGVKTSTIEPHLLDFDGDLYGQEITISFLRYLRPMTTFASTDVLKGAIKDDIAWIRTNLPL